MTQSMTAFSRVQKQLDSGQLSWEIRSVNHRYLDVSFRIPDFLRFIEPALRTILKNHLNRGKIECQLKFVEANAQNPSMLINKGMVNALIESAQDIAALYPIADDLKLSHVMSWPGVVQVGVTDCEVIAEQAQELYIEAIAGLKEARILEGVSLKNIVLARLSRLQDEVAQAKELVLGLTNEIREKWLKKLHKVQLEVSDARFEQEIAVILSKMDVGEELDRLNTHIQEVRRCLNLQESSGRRLDFLMQELNREANTLSSKSDSVVLTQCAVEMKVLIEQMREQIQNIE